MMIKRETQPLSSSERCILVASLILAPDFFLNDASCPPLPRATLCDIAKAGVKHHAWCIIDHQPRCSAIHHFAQS